MIFISNVTLGYGNPEYLNFARAWMNNRSDKVKFIEPLDYERDFYPLDVDFIRLSKGNEKLKIVKEFPSLLLSKIFIKIYNFICINSLIIFSMFFYKDEYIVTSKYHVLLSMAPKNKKIIYYGSELFDIDKMNGFFFKHFKSKVKAVLCPQLDRIKLLEKSFKDVRFYYVQNCPWLEDRFPIKNKKFSKFSILYQGRIGKLSNAELLIELFKVINEKKIAEVHCAGPIDNQYKEDFLSLCEKDGINYYGYLTAAELKSIRDKCNIGIISWSNDTLHTKYCAPNKLYEYISDGLVVLSIPNYSMNNFNKEINFGFVAENNISDIVKYLESIDENILNNISKNNVQSYHEYLNYQKQISNFLSDMELFR